MDQSSSILSDSSALYITFFGRSGTSGPHPMPRAQQRLQAMPVPLPRRARFVVAHSLVVADKARSASVGYNLRVLETRVGARILGRALGLGALFVKESESGSGGENENENENENGNGEVLGERATLREVLEVHAWRAYPAHAGGVEGEGRNEEEDWRLERALRFMLASGALECLKPPAPGVLGPDFGAAGGTDDNNGRGRTGVTLEEMVRMCGMEREEFWRVYMGMGEGEFLNKYPYPF